MSLGMRIGGVGIALLAASALACAQGPPGNGFVLLAQHGRPPMRQQQRGPQMGMPPAPAPQQPQPDQQQPQQPRGAEAQTVPPHRGPHAGQWLRNILALPLEQRQQALESDPQFQQLPADRQQQLRERLAQFSSLSADKQQRILDRMDRFGHLSPEQQQQARQLFHQFRELAPERRSAVMKAYRALRNLAPAARQRILGSPQYQQGFSDDERSLLMGFTDLDLAPRQEKHGDTGDGGNPPE